MKKLETLGRNLSKNEQKKIFGGDENVTCYEVICKDVNNVELGTIYTTQSSGQWITACRGTYPATTTTGGSDCGCSNCGA
jgi:hypothetical protein